MKIGIVGCGNVGSAAAYACLLQGVGTELVLVDQNEELARAQAEDISHATPFSKMMSVQSGNYDLLHGSGIVIISAGVSQKTGESRLDLLKRNADVFEKIIPVVLKNAPEAILLIATNPVDIMTHMADNIASKHGHTKGRVIGTGTILDTARFRTLLSQHLGISSHSIHAYVLGEHGDSEVLDWSGVRIGNILLEDFSMQMKLRLDKDDISRIDNAVRYAGKRIQDGKGATWFGIASGAARIAKAIINDEQSVLTCCAPLNKVESIENVTLSLPHLISAKGIEASIYPDLGKEESEKLQESAQLIKVAITSIGY